MKLQSAHLKKWILAEQDYFSFINTDNFEMQVVWLDLQFILSCRIIFFFFLMCVKWILQLKTLSLGLKTVSFLEFSG